MESHHLKGKIIAEILNVYPGLPDEFRAHDLFQVIRTNIFGHYRKFPYADTVMRYFRTLRETGVIKCQCVNRQKSLYKKQP